MKASRSKLCPLPSPSSTASFWHSEPDLFLKGHRTTEELPKYAKTVIIGSGITGASAARYLHDLYHQDSLILEAREACWGATGRNGGHIQPLLYSSPVDIVRFELANCVEVKEIIESNDIDCEYRYAPSCRTVWTEDGWDRCKRAVARLEKEAPDLAARLTLISTPEELSKAGVQARAAGAVLVDGAGSLWPYKYVAWILTDLIKKGALNLQTNTPVEKIEAVSSDSIDDSKSHPQYKIETPRGTVLTHNVLLATNAYTSHLVPSFADLIVPVRDTMTALIPPTSQPNRLPHSYGFDMLSPRSKSPDYLIQRPFNKDHTQGHLMFGGGRVVAATLPSVGEADDSVIDEAIVKYLSDMLPQALLLGDKVPKSLTPAAAWTGIWAASRDASPWVGQILSEPKGLFISGGYTGHGMPLATLCAKAVVDMIIEENNGGDYDKFVDKLVQDGRLPRSFAVTKSRIDEASTLLDVETQSNQGLLGFRTNLSEADQLGYF